jgi:hypothetical protein
MQIVSSGCFYRKIGQTSMPHFTSLSQKPSFATEHPTAAWTARQLLEACGTDNAPHFLVRDRDAIYGETFRRQVTALKIQEVLTAPRSPW